MNFESIFKYFVLAVIFSLSKLGDTVQGLLYSNIQRIESKLHELPSKSNSLVCEATNAVKTELCIRAFNELNPRTRVKLESITDSSHDQELTCEKMPVVFTEVPPNEELDLFPCRITAPATENENAIDSTFFLTQGDTSKSVIIIVFDLRYKKYFVYYQMILDEEDKELFDKLIHQKMKKPSIQLDSYPGTSSEQKKLTDREAFGPSTLGTYTRYHIIPT